MHSEAVTFYDQHRRQDIVTIEPREIYHFVHPPWESSVFTQTMNISAHHYPQKPGYFIITEKHGILECTKEFKVHNTINKD